MGFNSAFKGLNKSIGEGIETEVSQLNFMITYFREENRHDINNVNSKVNKLTQSVAERINGYMAEDKSVQNNINKELTKQKLETECNLSNIRSELSNVRQRVADRTPKTIQQKLDSEILSLLWVRFLQNQISFDTGQQKDTATKIKGGE